MTEEEKFCNKRCYSNPCRHRCEYVSNYLDGLAEGRKESGKEINVLTKENKELKAQIEKMKCCANCKKRHSCIKRVNFIYPEMLNPINYGCINLSKWELQKKSYKSLRIKEEK